MSKGARKSDPVTRLRARAEMLVRESSRKTAILQEIETRKLLHELRVYQAELEMQNEELRRAQLELEAARDRFSTLYEFAPVGYLTLDAEGRIREANLAAAAMLGDSRNKLPGKKLVDFVAKPARDVFYLHHWKAEETGVTHTSQLPMCRRDGTAFSVVLASVMISDGESLSRQHLVILNDVTDRLRAEAEHARLAAIVESSNDAIISRDLNDVITSWNKGAEQMLGYQAEEIIGHSFRELMPPELRADLDRQRQSILKGEPIERFETKRVRKDGRIILTETWFSPIRNAMGRVTGISTIARDISRQKHAEEASRLSEQNLADFFAASPLGLLWVSPEGDILRVNRSQLELMRSPEQKVLGRPVSEFLADPEIAEDLLKRLARNETIQSHRVRLRQRNGSLLQVLIDANGLWAGGRLVHSRWFVRDITRRVELEREILRVSEREQRRLGRDLHDDLGQQLAGIEFLAEALAGELAGISKPAAARTREIARLARNTMVRTRELARGLSPIGLETDGLMVALRELAARTEKLFRLNCRFRCKTPVLIRDHEMGLHLYRIAQEAVSNAIKHGKARRVDIGLTAYGDRIVLAVSDNGIGLTKNPGNHKGMGLRVMQYRAGMIDASLVAQRQPDGGTTFVCTVKKEPLRSRWIEKK